MRVTFIIGHLGLGGAERVLCFMADYWVKKGWSVQLITLENSSLEQFYFPSESVVLNDFNINHARKNGIPKLRMLSSVAALRKVIKHTQPDVVISFMNTSNIFTLLAMFGMPIPKIVCERSEPRYEALAASWRRLRLMLYPFATSVVTQSSAALTYFKGITRRKGRVIPNHVLEPRNAQGQRYRAPGNPKNKTVLALGRLVGVKQFDLLIQAFAHIAEQHPTWSLEIWGEGPERQKLEALVTTLNLSDRVKLPGLTTEPYETMMRGDLFVLCSRYEGFPNALCEAMACGLPVISFNSPGGVGEIVRHEIDGLLTPNGDVQQLAAAMNRLMGDTETRLQLAARASEICDRFNADVVMGMWEELVRQVVQR